MIESSHRKIVVTAIHAELPQCRIYAFGSRVRGDSKPYSDLDIAIDNTTPIDLRSLRRIEETLSASDIPYKIDLLDFQTASADFQRIISSTSTRW